MTNRVRLGKNLIFKYGTLKHLEDTILNNSLGFSKVSSLNDPFEIAHKFQINRKSISEDPISYKYKKLIESKKEFLNNAQISCFSRTAFEPLMWSHYSDKHYGICYCFDENELTTFGLCSSFKDIIYSSQLPEIYYEEDKTSDKQIQRELNRVLMTKSLNWSYEKEFRIILKKGVENKFKSRSLRAIILGFNAAIYHKERILKVIEKANAIRKDDIKVYYASLSTEKYEILIENEPNHSLSENTTIYF